MKRARLFIFVVMTVIAVMLFATSCSDKGGEAGAGNGNANVVVAGAAENEKYSEIYNYSLKILGGYEHSRVIIVPAEKKYLSAVAIGAADGLTELIYAFIPASKDSTADVLKAKILFFSNDTAAQAYFDSLDSTTEFILGNKVFLNFSDDVRHKIDAATPITVEDNVKSYFDVLLDNDFFVSLSKDPVIAVTNFDFMLGGGNSAAVLGSITNSSSIPESADLSYNVAVNFFSDNASALAVLQQFGGLTFDEEKNAYRDENAPSGMDKILYKVVDNIFFQCRYNVYNALINDGLIIKEYTVGFYDGDTLLKTETVSYGGSAIAPIVEAKGILIFNGWDKDYSNVTSDLTVTAIRTKPIKSIAYKQGSMKERYFVGENLDTSGGKLIVTFIDDSGEEVPIFPYMVSSFNRNNSAGSETAIISYKGFEAVFGYTVLPNENKITSVTELIAPNVKTEYFWGEDFSFGYSAKIKVTYSDGTKLYLPIAEANYETEQGPSYIEGITLVSVFTYLGKRQSVNMKPSFNGLDEINLRLKISYGTYPEVNNNTPFYLDYKIKKGFKTAEIIGKPKILYNYGDLLDINGTKLRIINVDGSEKIVDLTEDMISGFDSTPNMNSDGVSTGSMTITYRGVNVGSITYSVLSDVRAISINAPFKTAYNLGESIDVSGGKLLITKADGTTEIINITADMISSFYSTSYNSELVSVYNGKNILKREMTLRYKGIDIRIPYTIETDVEEFTIDKSTFCDRFKIGDKLDFNASKTVADIKYKDGTAIRTYISSDYHPSPEYGIYNPITGEFLHNTGVTIYGFDTTKAGTFEMSLVYHLKVIKVQYTVE